MPTDKVADAIIDYQILCMLKLLICLAEESRVFTAEEIKKANGVLGFPCFKSGEHLEDKHLIKLVATDDDRAMYWGYSIDEDTQRISILECCDVP